MIKQKIVFLLLACMLLAGCSQASQVENHAYVLVMGIDKAPNGQIEMTVQVPRISGGNQQSSDGKNGSDSYTRFAVTAADYEAALAKLNWASPRDLTLSQLKLIVFSKEIAADEHCRALIRNIAQTERLYTAARVAVCEGRASDFIQAIKPNIGTHISEDIDAMYEHYTSSGYVPESRLADLFYQTESVYSDPMVTYALLHEDAKSAAALSGGIREVSDSYDSAIPTRYLGAAVFSGGKLAGVLDGTQTMIACLLRNEIEAIRYECDGQTLTIVPARATYTRVDLSGVRPRIRISAHLSIAAQERRPDEAALRSSLETDIQSVISEAQSLKTEPFGFAEKAARRFSTLEKWRAYDWKRRFTEAEVEIELSFAHSDA